MPQLYNEVYLTILQAYMALNDVDSSAACFLKALELEPTDGIKLCSSCKM